MEEDSIMEYIKIESEIVTGHYCSKVLPESTASITYTELTGTFGGYIGINSNWLSLPEGSRISDADLVIAGIREDNRGTYYSIADSSVTKVIKNLDANAPDGYTLLDPSVVKYPIWDAESICWKNDDAAEIDALKSIAKSTAKSDKNTLLSNGFEYGGKIIQADDDSRSAFSEYFIMKDFIPYPVNWRTLDNSYLEITSALMLTEISGSMLNFYGYLIEEYFLLHPHPLRRLH